MPILSAKYSVMKGEVNILSPLRLKDGGGVQ